MKFVFAAFSPFRHSRFFIAAFATFLLAVHAHASAPPQVAITAPTHNGFAIAGWSITGTVTDNSGTGFANDRVTFTLYKDGKYWTGSQWQDTQVALHAPIMDG